jgi:DNA polymerase I-like protein with 3'-5' exonuclease and polymerase domains
MTMQDGVMLISGRRVPTGRMRNGSSRAYANMNYLIQGSARELLVGAWHRFASKPGRAEMAWFPIHDELVLHVPEALADEVAAEVGEAMSFDFYGVPIKADADILIDRSGRSRWMTGDLAKEIRLERAA